MPDHLRCDPGLVDEDESRCIELGLLSLERSASSSNVRTILLGGARRFFEGDIVTVVKSAATRAEAYSLATALKAIGEPHLGAAALICFEWLQRPENVLTGKITWPDYRGPEHPDRVRIFHHKTGEVVLQPLEDRGRKLYPELEVYLAELPRLGVPIVVTKGSRGPSRPYAMVYAQAKVREARERAGLASHVTLDACRHGGMTELGDAELTEQGVMALSGHRTPQAARLYVKRTQYQRLRAAAKRRNFVEGNETATRVDLEGDAQSRLGTKGSDKTD